MDRIFLPEKSRKQVLVRYHHHLCHPRRDRIYNTMIATLYCDKMEKDVTDLIKATMTPWDSVCIDLIGPYIVTDRLGNYKKLNVTIFVDTATG